MLKLAPLFRSGTVLCRNRELRIFGEAEAFIEGCTLRLSCANVANPVSARYAHWNWCVVNLFGESGLPLAPFILE